MSYYLFFNIATKIVIPKMQKKSSHYQKEYSTHDITQKVSQYFDMSLFHIEDNDHEVCLVLKDEMTKQYLYPFLKEHLSYLHHHNYLDEIEKIKDMGTQEVIDYLENEDIDYVYFNHYDYLKYTYLDNELKMYREGIYYLFEGKLYLGNCQNLLTYLHQTIRKLHNNPLEGAVYISIQ